MTQNHPTKPARRTALALMMVLGAYFLTAIPVMALFEFQGFTFLIPLIAAVAVARYVWVHADDMPKHLAGSILYGAVLYNQDQFPDTLVPHGHERIQFSTSVFPLLQRPDPIRVDLLANPRAEARGVVMAVRINRGSEVRRYESSGARR
jgi:hypothetical protein